MPSENLARNHFTESQIEALDQALALVLESLTPMTVNLTPKERSKYGKVGPQKELLIDKVKDFLENQPNKASPDVDWEEFLLDYKDRKTAWQLLAKTRSIERMLMNIKILSDHDNYNAALRDYQYAQYRDRFSSGDNFATKIQEVRAFFPKTGKSAAGPKKKKE